MATTEASRSETVGARNVSRRLSTETKSAWKTTELMVYVVATAAILIAAWVVDGDAAGEPDVFTADKAWLYVAIVTVGYMVSRGLAKSGSSDPYTDDTDHRG